MCKLGIIIEIYIYTYIETYIHIYIYIIIPSLHTKNSARRHTIPMKLLWHLADMPTMFGKSWRSIVPLAFCTMRIFVIPRVRSVVCYQLCCTAIPCMCTGIASIYIYIVAGRGPVARATARWGKLRRLPPDSRNCRLLLTDNSVRRRVAEPTVDANTSTA